MAEKNKGANLGFENKLWEMADKMRGHMDYANQTSSQTIYTVGHSNYEADGFVKILHSHSIEVVVDVRSAPYSKYCPQFNKQTIEQVLKSSAIKYLFLGKELGARPKDQNCYINGKVSFEKLRETELFKRGIARLLDGIKECNTAVMCSEKDPINCHRAVLISRVLANKGVTVKHILNERAILDHAELEEQLLKKFKMEDTLFDNKSSKRANLEQAYQKQEKTISYQDTVQEGTTS